MCGTLWRASLIDDLSSYYPEESYYSFQGDFCAPASYRLFYTRLKSWLFLRTPSSFWKHPVPVELQWLRACNASLDDRILDVGCGDGHFLFSLYKIGFRHLEGIDPYLPENVMNPAGVKLKSQSLFESVGVYDHLFFHHSLEHMRDPLDVLKQAHSLLGEGGSLLIRTPCIDSYAWETYQENWAQIDAPRHEQIFSRKGITLLAERSGFSVQRFEYDSNEFQFWASEQYQKDIPLYDNRSHFIASESTLFSREQLHALKQRAQELNLAERGDQFCVYLKKSAT